MIRLGLRLCATLVLISAATLPSSGQEAQETDAPAAKPPATQESTHKVKRERLKIEVNLTGVFEAAEVSPVVLRPNSWSSFSVLEAVPHGKKVKKGDQLVRLDMTQIDEKLQDLEQAEQLSVLSQRVAQTDWELLQKTIPLDLKAAEQAKRIANEELSYFMKTDRAFQEESTRFSLKSSRDSLEYTEEELKQLEKMYKADDLTEETEEIVLKRARNEVERSKFYLKSSELRAKRTLEQDLPREEQQKVEAAQRADIALAKATVALPVQMEKQKLELEKQRLADQRAHKNLEELRQDREMMALRSPAEGYVYYGTCTRGKWSGFESAVSQLTVGGKLTPNTVFMTVVNPRPVWIRVDVPEKELYRLTGGVQGTAIPDGYPGLELATSLDKVSPFPISKGIFDAQFQVTLGDSARPVVPGMGCKLTLVAYDEKDAITVPSGAVFEDDADGKRDVVYVRRGDDQSEKRKVVIGQKTDQKWEIVRGLKEGEEILLKKPD